MLISIGVYIFVFKLSRFFSARNSFDQYFAYEPCEACNEIHEVYLAAQAIG